MRDPLVRRDGRWLMTCLNSKRRNTHHPVNGSPGFSFHLRDTELLVTAFPGCRTRFFLPITTCHATASRLSLSLSLSPPSLFLSLSPALASCLALTIASPLGWSSSFFSPISFCHTLWLRAQSPISNDYARRSPQVDPTATHERSRLVQSRGSVHEGVRIALFLFLLSSFLYRSYLPPPTVSESKTMDYTRKYTLHRREGERTNSNIWPTFRISKIDRDIARSMDYVVIAPNRMLENLTYIDLFELRLSLLYLGQ